MPKYEDLSKKLNALHVSWFNAMQAQEYRTAAFYGNDLVDLAQKMRRESFIQLDQQQQGEQKP